MPPRWASLLGPNCLLIEYGSGASTKTRLLLDHLPDPAAYVPVDIALEQLQESSGAWRGTIPVWTSARSAPTSPGISTCHPWMAPVQRRVVYFPGSTIGNLTPA